MIRVGLLGEAPHDTNAITNLLGRHFGESVLFFPMVNSIRGSQIEEQRIKRLLRREYEIEKPHIVVFIRDLDGLEEEEDKVSQRKLYFSEFRSVVDGKGILLLNIYAIEALILADIEAYNNFRGCSVEQVLNPMRVTRPEIYLKMRSPYTEGQLSEIFGHLRVEVIRANCPYFDSFFEEFTLFVHSLAK